MIVEPSIPPPATYGLPPAKFRDWRRHQQTAIVRANTTDRRFAMIVASTGFGKFCVGETIARYHTRSMYLTVTRILQDLIGAEVPDRFDIRGRANYDCHVLADAGLTGWQARCDQAESLCEACALREGGCDFYDAMRRLAREPRVLTNYAKWLATDPKLLGGFDCLICDEAHGAVDQLCRAMRVELDPEAVGRFCDETLPDEGERSISDWSRWAGRWFTRLEPRMRELASRVAGGERQRMAELRGLRGLLRALEAAAVMGDEWIEDRSGMGRGRADADRVAFEPIWPRRYRERLFMGIGDGTLGEDGAARRPGKIVLMSATVTMKDAELLGIDPSEIDYAEYPSSFPIERRPVVYVPTVAQRWDMTEGERVEAVRRVDQIIDARLDRKGIVYTVSFDRARHLLANSRHAHSGRLIMNDSASRDPELATAAVIERFRRAPPGTWLVSPSIVEGYDFAGPLCECVVILKVPLGQRKGNPLFAARCRDDGDYDVWQAMKKIVQVAGRGMRAATDRCEVIVIDDQWGRWFWRAGRRFAPQWFRAAVWASEYLPPPPPKLEEGTWSTAVI